MTKNLKLTALLLAILALTPPSCAAKHPQDASPAAAETPAQVENTAPAATKPSAKDTAQAAEPTGPVFKIMPGDILQITVWKEDGLDREVLVLPEGSITFPLIGTIAAQGHSTSEVQDMIKKKLKKLIPDASVSVSVKAALGHTVSVIGQVNKPGELVMSSHITVMQALSQAGGLTPYAREGRVIVLRRIDGTETSIPVPYSSIVKGDDLDQDISLQPGDVVVVPTAGLI